MKLCDYCGDEAPFQRVDGGRAFCRVCASLALADVAPNSDEHRKLRPYICSICGKLTSSPVSCARLTCIAVVGDSN